MFKSHPQAVVENVITNIRRQVNAQSSFHGDTREIDWVDALLDRRFACNCSCTVYLTLATLECIGAFPGDVVAAAYPGHIWLENKKTGHIWEPTSRQCRIADRSCSIAYGCLHEYFSTPEDVLLNYVYTYMTFMAREDRHRVQKVGKKVLGFVMSKIGRRRFDNDYLVFQIIVTIMCGHINRDNIDLKKCINHELYPFVQANFMNYLETLLKKGDNVVVLHLYGLWILLRLLQIHAPRYSRDTRVQWVINEVNNRKNTWTNIVRDPANKLIHGTRHLEKIKEILFQIQMRQHMGRS
jgi:hypothetical protein